MAEAVALWDWDGIMPGNNAQGLNFREGEVVTVGRIVNGKWYQGYFPRGFFRVQRILRFQCKEDFGDDAPTDESTDNQSEPAVAPSTTVNKWSVSKILGRASAPLPPPEGRPELPPSPVRGPPAYDKTFSGNRLILRFKLESKDADGNYTLRAALALNSAPGARFSSLTFSMRLSDGSILAIFPETISGPESEAEITKDKNIQATVNASLETGSVPVTAGVGASTTFTRTLAEHMMFTRRTRGTIQGTGVGTTEAYWVLKEDCGPAAQNGLDPKFSLAAKLDVRPAVISYEIVIGICREKGKGQMIRSGTLSMSV